MNVLYHEMQAAGPDRHLVWCLRQALGATGAVGTTVFNGNALMSSIVRNSAGLYTLTFRQKFPANALIGWSIGHQFAGVTPAGRGAVWTVESSALEAATPTVVIRCSYVVAAGGTAADPPDSAVLNVALVINRGKL